MSYGLEVWDGGAGLSFTTEVETPRFLQSFHLPANSEGSHSFHGHQKIYAVHRELTTVLNGFGQDMQPWIRVDGNTLTWGRPLFITGVVSKINTSATNINIFV